MDRLVHKKCIRFRQKFVCQMKNNYKEIRNSWIYEKVWLKAAKSISGKWILLNSCAWNATPPPHLPSKVTVSQLLISLHLVLNYLFAFFRQILKLTTFLPHLISCSVQHLYLNKVVLPWSDYIFVFNEMGTEKPRIRKSRNTVCKQLITKRRRSTILPSYIAFMWMI